MNSIQDFILTGFERDKLFNFLDQFDQIIFNSTLDVKSYINTNVPPEQVAWLTGYLTQTGTAPDSIFAQSRALRHTAEAWPTIALTIAFAPTRDMALRVVDLARKSTGKAVIVDFKVDPTLIGGAVVEGNGKIGEYSFRKYFEDH